MSHYLTHHCPKHLIYSLYRALLPISPGDCFVFFFVVLLRYLSIDGEYCIENEVGRENISQCWNETFLPLTRLFLMMSAMLQSILRSKFWTIMSFSSWEAIFSLFFVTSCFNSLSSRDIWPISTFSVTIFVFCFF